MQRQEPLKAELQAFVEAVEMGGVVPVSGEDGLAALKLSLALVQSGIENRVVQL